MVGAALPKTFAVDGRPLCWLSVGATIYVGPPLDLSAHARMVGALILGISGPLTISAAGPQVHAETLFIPAGSVTEILDAPSKVAVCTFDPTATRISRCTRRMRPSAAGLHVGHRDEKRLIEAVTDDEFRPHDILRLVGVDSSPSAENRPIDPRIAAVGARICSDPFVTISAAEAAATARLSQAYFLTLFARETGTTFRRYRLWVRLVQAATAIGEGKSMTDAATDAGFASPSHLSDAARTLLGMSAKAALATGARLLVDSV